ncbi:unnamed protein product [Ranitomeya imitator]|uniref:Olfactory receptor n=1 Tax=Ranitomeya imitator TaxID=111125 RepID=A0ABN9MFG1_9NEOB|nr:unnamed protein product [Ranitomeya imitator]
MVVDDEEKANILNTFFSTVFTVENEMLGEIPRNNENPILRVTNLTQEEVRNRLNKIKIDKSPGPDGIHPRVLRELSNVIDKPLFLIFSDSIATGSVPQDWRIANVVPIFKKGSKSEPGNYRPSNKQISFTGCISQQYFYIAFAVAEYFLLAAMAYDRYVAICKPLHYPFIMNSKTCLLLSQGCWLTGFVSSSFPVSLSSRLNFCKSHVINHFFCDLTALLKLSCGKNANIEVLILVESLVLGFMPFMFTLASYVIIVRMIGSIRVKDGRIKAFSTCSSHLTVVILFYGTMIGIYMRPPSMYSPAHDKLFALLYTAVIPMINPMIYTLRNGEVKNIIKKGLHLS